MGSIRVLPPAGSGVDVTITRVVGSKAVVAYSAADYTGAVALPENIRSAKTYYLPDDDTYRVSLSIGGIDAGSRVVPLFGTQSVALAADVDLSVENIAEELGSNPQGASATVKARLDNIETSWVRGPRHPDDPSFRTFAVVMLHNFADLTTAQGILKDYKAWGYETIFYSQMMDYLATGDATDIPEKPLVICCDDGGLSSYEYLYPALVEFGMKATYFIVPDWIEGTISTPANGGSFLEATPFTWANANTMYASGVVDFESHTCQHGSMRLLSAARTYAGNGEGAGADFEASKALIEARIPGVTVEYNAAPYGVINEAAITSLKASSCKGNRITNCGKNQQGEYDGTGPLAFTLWSTDPYRVPIADIGNFKSLRRANIYGTADPDGNRIQNGRFLVTSRGFTLPTGWSLSSQTLPDVAGGSGNVLRGAGTSAATGAYHTDLIPVGYYTVYSLDWWVKFTKSTATSARLVLDCYDTMGGTLVKTLADPPGAQTTDTAGAWQLKRWTIYGDNTYQFVRPRFEIVSSAAGSEMQVWDARLRVQKNPLEAGSWRPATFS